MKLFADIKTELLKETEVKGCKKYFLWFNQVLIKICGWTWYYSISVIEADCDLLFG